MHVQMLNGDLGETEQSRSEKLDWRDGRRHLPISIREPQSVGTFGERVRLNVGTARAPTRDRANFRRHIARRPYFSPAGKALRPATA